MEEFKMDGIPIKDYGRSSRTVYGDNFNFIELGAMQGWQCPICKRVLAPFVQECPCQGEGKKTLTVATTKEE